MVLKVKLLPRYLSNINLAGPKAEGVAIHHGMLCTKCQMPSFELTVDETP
jgi:hypothetical protein